MKDSSARGRVRTGVVVYDGGAAIPTCRDDDFPTELGMRAIGPDAYQITVPMPRHPDFPDNVPAHVTHVYLIKERLGWVLIDTGFESDEGWRHLVEGVRETGVTLRDIRRTVVTHAHMDHSGLAYRLQSETNTEVALHVKDGPEVVRRRFEALNGENAHDALRAFASNGVPEAVLEASIHRHWRPDSLFGLRVDIPLSSRETVLPDMEELRLIWTPGHTAGHVSIHDTRRRLLYSGDHVLGHTTPNVQYSVVDGDWDPLGDFLDSLKHVRDLDVDMVYPPHGWKFRDLAGRVDEIVRHHEERLAEMERAMDAGPCTAWEVASRVRWNVAPWPQLKPRVQMMAMGETLAHLVFLVKRGRVVSWTVGSRVLYARRHD